MTESILALVLMCWNGEHWQKVECYEKVKNYRVYHECSEPVYWEKVDGDFICHIDEQRGE